MSITFYIALGVVVILIAIAIANATNKILMKIYENKKLLQEIKNDLRGYQSEL